MLFLNAGIGEPGAFADLSTVRLERIVNINVVHPTYIARVLLGQMLDRSQRSAIVVTSSGLGMAPVAGVSAYSASKAYVSTLAQALSYEVEHKIDVVDWVAGETSTKMLRVKNNSRTVTPEVSVRGML